MPQASLTIARRIPLDSKVHGANMGPIWGWQDPGGPHVGPMNFAIWDSGVHIPAVICWCPFIVYLLEINASHITGHLWGESTSNQWFNLRKDQWNIYLFLAWRSCWKNWKLPMIWDAILLMWRHSNELACYHSTSQMIYYENSCYLNNDSILSFALWHHAHHLLIQLWWGLLNQFLPFIDFSHFFRNIEMMFICCQAWVWFGLIWYFFKIRNFAYREMDFGNSHSLSLLCKTFFSGKHVLGTIPCPTIHLVSNHDC